MYLTTPLSVGICIFIFIIINSVMKYLCAFIFITFQIISLGELLFLDTEWLG